MELIYGSTDSDGNILGSRGNRHDDERTGQCALCHGLRHDRSASSQTFKREENLMSTGSIIALSILGAIIGLLLFSSHMLKEIRKDRENSDLHERSAE
jgi:hypothetical protein